MNGVVIFDGKGYFVKRRRVDGRVIDLWSPRKQDAALFHFLEVARRFTSTIPQRVRLLGGDSR
jgi:hypothetical protein